MGILEILGIEINESHGEKRDFAELRGNRTCGRVGISHRISIMMGTHSKNGSDSRGSRNLVVLGATGSIGTQTLEVVGASNGSLRVLGLSAHQRWQELFAQAQQYRPRWLALTDLGLRDEVDASDLGDEVEILWGDVGVARMVTDPETDIVVAAMVGAAGLASTMQALEAGKDIALANKETLVVGGNLVTALAARRQCRLLPVDSEHSAIFQCLQAGQEREVQRIILTASGGPFRQTPLEDFANLSREQALRHPTWNMGPKITIDSATMMNKALEIIEAHWLFGLPADRIEVVIHPQSMVHSMVEFVDGSVIAQLSPPDMRLPIQYALTYPHRQPGPCRRLNLRDLRTWDFDLPDPARYPALRLGYEVIERGGTCGAALNGANEVAVARFLHGEIRFPEIVELCRAILYLHPFINQPTLDDLRDVDRWARQEAKRWSCSTLSSVSYMS